MLFLASIIALCLNNCGAKCKIYSPHKKTCLSSDLAANLSVDGKLLYNRQKVIHCTSKTATTKECKKFWSSTENQYFWKLRDHYEPLRQQRNHSVNRDKRRVRVDKATNLVVDIVIDARCHHSWPYNPYHRCVVFGKYSNLLFFRLACFY